MDGYRRNAWVIITEIRRLDLIIKKKLGICIDWSRIDKYAYLAAMEKSVADSTEIKRLLRNALTDKVNDREMFMEGIDYSYYYEEQLKKVRTAYPI